MKFHKMFPASFWWVLIGVNILLLLFSFSLGDESLAWLASLSIASCVFTLHVIELQKQQDKDLEK